MSYTSIISFVILFYNVISLVSSEQLPIDIGKAEMIATSTVRFCLPYLIILFYPKYYDWLIVYYFCFLIKRNEQSSQNNANDGNLGFLHAFVASLSVIVVSELGDKTFFIAAIMAMRHPRLTVFIGAIGALALMTILSGC